jgi:hypothetical protein
MHFVDSIELYKHFLNSLEATWAGTQIALYNSW